MEPGLGVRDGRWGAPCTDGGGGSEVPVGALEREPLAKEGFPEKTKHKLDLEDKDGVAQAEDREAGRNMCKGTGVEKDPRNGGHCKLVPAAGVWGVRERRLRGAGTRPHGLRSVGVLLRAMGSH